MPTYDYECEACKKRFEVFHSMSEIRKKCPRCGEPRLKRLIGPGSGFLFRGSGFYITDYRSSDYQSRVKAESEKSKPPDQKSEGQKSEGQKSEGQKSEGQKSEGQKSEGKGEAKKPEARASRPARKAKSEKP